MAYETDKQIEDSIMKLPLYVVMGWCEYKGDVYFASINYERTVKAKRPIINLHYCATKALNNIVEKTVQYTKWKFSEHNFETKQIKPSCV